MTIQLEIPINPFSSEQRLRYYLSKIDEYNELDSLLKFYLRVILKKRIYESPSKGPYGEKGKDIVAIEDETTLSYCSYIVKSGNLNENLDGDYGILKQLEDAMYIPLEEEMYQDKKRTAIVVYNGEEGYRGAISKFENKRMEIERTLGNEFVLRNIERWDIDVLVNKLFPHAEELRNLESLQNRINRMHESEKLITDLKNEIKDFLSEEEALKLIDRYGKKIGEIERKYGPFNNE